MAGQKDVSKEKLSIYSMSSARSYSEIYFTILNDVIHVMKVMLNYVLANKICIFLNYQLATCLLMAASLGA